MAMTAKRMGRPPGEPSKVVRLPVPLAALAKRLASGTLRAGDIGKTDPRRLNVCLLVRERLERAKGAQEFRMREAACLSRSPGIFKTKMMVLDGRRQNRVSLPSRYRRGRR